VGILSLLVTLPVKIKLHESFLIVISTLYCTAPSYGHCQSVIRIEKLKAAHYKFQHRLLGIMIHMDSQNENWIDQKKAELRILELIIKERRLM